MRSRYYALRKQVGRRVRRHRRRHYSSQKAMAAVLGVSVHRVKRMELGRRWPTFRLVCRMGVTRIYGRLR